MFGEIKIQMIINDTTSSAKWQFWKGIGNPNNDDLLKYFEYDEVIAYIAAALDGRRLIGEASKNVTEATIQLHFVWNCQLRYTKKSSKDSTQQNV